MAIKYPRVPYDLQLSTVLTLEQIKEIQKLYNLGLNQTKLANKFKVSRTTIRYWVNPLYNKLQRMKTTEKNRLLRLTEVGRKKLNEYDLERNKRRRKRNDYNEYLKQYCVERHIINYKRKRR